MFTEYTISFNIKEFHTFTTDSISVFCVNVKWTLIRFYTVLPDLLLLPRGSVFTARFDLIVYR